MRNQISRRNLLTGAAALAPGYAVLSAQGSPLALAYIGTYSSPQGPEGSAGHGRGIYLYEMNPQTGELGQRELFATDANPSWLALNPDKTRLYSANEITNFDGSSGSVTAWSVHQSSGKLTSVSTVSSEGAGPAHLSVHPSGRYIFVANYAGGTVAVLPIEANGRLGRATDVKADQGSPGPKQPTSAPPGSFAISGHDHPHAHMVESDPTGRFVLAADLALDRIYIWRFDPDRGKLTASDPAWVSLPPGDGPRHFVFHPNGRWFYSLQEESSTLAAFDYDNGKLAAKQTLSTLAKGFAGTNFTSEVSISSSGRFLYAANRLHDTIAFFSIDASGRLAWIGEEWTRGDYPRSFSFDPTGRFLYCCNQRSDCVTCFRVNSETGALSFTGQYTPIGTPARIVFLR
ncbi:MAG: lactonase family protein [Acidobacteriaceae bacterium]|nr:lactonase family protein [Acidobacteriaceae bacterium]MBV9503228.1 lactonase family protein [Acidobacteriaceae bacterium]